MAAALQFPLTHPVVASVLPGPRTVDQARGVIAAFREPIPARLWADLAESGLIPATALGRAHPIAAALPEGRSDAD